MSKAGLETEKCMQERKNLLEEILSNGVYRHLSTEYFVENYFDIVSKIPEQHKKSLLDQFPDFENVYEHSKREKIFIFLKNLRDEELIMDCLDNYYQEIEQNIHFPIETLAEIHAIIDSHIHHYYNSRFSNVQDMQMINEMVTKCMQELQAFDIESDVLDQFRAIVAKNLDEYYLNMIRSPCLKLDYQEKREEIEMTMEDKKNVCWSLRSDLHALKQEIKHLSSLKQDSEQEIETLTDAIKHIKENKFSKGIDLSKLDQIIDKCSRTLKFTNDKIKKNKKLVSELEPIFHMDSEKKGPIYY